MLLQLSFVFKFPVILAVEIRVILVIFVLEFRVIFAEKNGEFERTILRERTPK